MPYPPPSGRREWHGTHNRWTLEGLIDKIIEVECKELGRDPPALPAADAPAAASRAAAVPPSTAAEAASRAARGRKVKKELKPEPEVKVKPEPKGLVKQEPVTHTATTAATAASRKRQRSPGAGASLPGRPAKRGRTSAPAAVAAVPPDASPRRSPRGHRSTSAGSC